MSDRTALSLKPEERLDLAELANACCAAGLLAGASARGLLVCIPGRRKRCRWKGTQEHGYLLMILRDAVRVYAPGSYCLPLLAEGYPPLVAVVLDASRLPIETDPLPSPYYGRGHTETECWARALVALYRAGLLPGGRA